MAHYRDINKLLITPFVWKQETFLEHFKGLGNAAISGISTIIINLKHSIDERKNDAFNKITGTNLDELKEIYEDLDYKILVSPLISLYHISISEYKEISDKLKDSSSWKEEDIDHFKKIGKKARRSLNTIIEKLEGSTDERKNDTFNKISRTNLDGVKELLEYLEYKLHVLLFKMEGEPKKYKKKSKIPCFCGGDLNYKNCGHKWIVMMENIDAREAAIAVENQAVKREIMKMFERDFVGTDTSTSLDGIEDVARYNQGQYYLKLLMINR